MVSQTVYFTGMMVFALTSQMYYRILVLVPVLVRVPEYLPTGTITSTGTITLELMEKWKILKKIYFMKLDVLNMCFLK